MDECVYAGFYKGRIAKAIVAALDEEKGVLDADDLEQHRSTITRPIHTTYRGHTIYEVPPPTQARLSSCKWSKCTGTIATAYWLEHADAPIRSFIH